MSWGAGCAGCQRAVGRPINVLFGSKQPRRQVAACRRVPAPHPSSSVREIGAHAAWRVLSVDGGENGPSVKEWYSVVEGTREGGADIAEDPEVGVAAEQRIRAENAEHDRPRNAVVSDVGDGEIRRRGRAVESKDHHALGERGGREVEEVVCV